MICTSPCFPRCTAEAEFTLKTMNKSFLGHNCSAHVPRNTAKDYIIEPIEKEVEPTQ